RFALTDQLRQHFVCAAVEIQKRDGSLTKPGKESIEWMKMINNEMESMTGTQMGLASLALIADRVGQRLGAFKAPATTKKAEKGNSKGKTKAKGKSKGKGSDAHA
ncbi:hypothetical protein KAI87_14625, partial [Myxococcota bacterium]|nr:hypothetical protein [Myxococcota bacterium]